MATYIALSQKVMRRIRAGDAPMGVAEPSTVVGQTGVAYEVTQFVNDAYEEIQNNQDEWAFRIARGTFNLTSGTRTYSRATIQVTLPTYDTAYSQLNADIYRYVICELTSVGTGDQGRCVFIPYEEWRGLWDIGNRGTGKPARFTVQPNGSLEFDPTPDNTYTITIDYRIVVHVLATDAAVPIFDSQYDEALVWGAVLQYCVTRDDTDRLQSKAQAQYDKIMRKMYREQLPEFYAGDFGT